MSRVLVVGAAGALGADLMDAFSAVGHEVVGLSRDNLDVTDVAAVHHAIVGRAYDVILNATAYNNVDASETPEGRKVAFAVNGEAPGIMARAAKESGATFVHFSTDYVFPGEKPEGYHEDDEPRPINAYGESKLAGERAVLDTGGRSFICRVSKLFGRQGTSASAKPSFVDIMVRLSKEKPALTIVDEEIGMPTFTGDIAEAVVRLIEGGYEPGVYHLVNEGPGVTWYGFAEEFFSLQGITTPRQAVSSAAFPKPAARPKFGKLVNTKFPPLRSRVDALRAYFAEKADDTKK